MEQIIDPISKELLLAELTPDRLLRHTNKGDNLVYVVTAANAPNVMRELGRLREIAFRASGGGTGLACDIDEFDTGEHGCKQLVVWDPEHEVILGGYRFLKGTECAFHADGQPHMATSHLFHFSDRFLRDYMPLTLELGRSFVNTFGLPAAAQRKLVFALDNLWDGLGALYVSDPEIEYFFGKFTMYPTYDRLSRDLILYFLRKHFDDGDGMIRPHKPLSLDYPEAELAALLPAEDFREDYRRLKQIITQNGTAIPPLVNSYMQISDTMKFFGTAVNDEFGNVEESGILIRVDEMFPDKRLRHVESYLAERKA